MVKILKFKSKKQEQILKKIDKLLVLDNKMVENNNFGDIIIDVNILNTDTKEFKDFINKIIDNKNILYNKNKNKIVIV